MFMNNDMGFDTHIHSQLIKSGFPKSIIYSPQMYVWLLNLCVFMEQMPTYKNAHSDVAKPSFPFSFSFLRSQIRFITPLIQGFKSL